MKTALRNTCLASIIAGTLLTGCHTPPQPPAYEEIATVTGREHRPAQIEPLFVFGVVIPWEIPERYLVTLRTRTCTDTLHSRELYDTARIRDAIPVRTQQLTEEHLVLSRYGIVARYTRNTGCELTIR